MSERSVIHLTSKTDFATQKFIQSDLTPSTPVAPPGITVKLDLFTLSANNITYALIGKALGYWNFFPPPPEYIEEWGEIPVWGFADVVTSSNPDIKIGARLFGYFPLATYYTMPAVDIDASGKFLRYLNREKFPELYRSYRIIPETKRENEKMEALLWVMFESGYLLATYTLKAPFQPGTTMIVNSASSKFALGFVASLRRRDDCPKIVGLVSKPAHAEFARATELYDNVDTYDGFLLRRAAGEDDKNVVLVDVAGRSSVIERLQEHFGDSLKSTILVGGTDWKAVPRKLAGPCKQFSGPTDRTVMMAELGEEKYWQLFDEAWEDFLKKGTKGLKVRYTEGEKGVLEEYAKILRREVEPDEGLLFRL